MRLISTILIGLGVSLLFASFLWPLFVTYRPAWSEAQAKELTQSAIALHEAQSAGQAGKRPTNNPEGDSSRPGEVALGKARERYERSRAAFDDTRARGDYPMRFLRWSGIGIALVGIVLFSVSRRDASGSPPR